MVVQYFLHYHFMCTTYRDHNAYQQHMKAEDTVLLSTEAYVNFNMQFNKYDASDIVYVVYGSAAELE